MVHDRWEGLASAVLMSAQVVLHAPKALQGRLLLPVLTALLPWTLHHHHSLRQADIRLVRDTMTE